MRSGRNKAARRVVLLILSGAAITAAGLAAGVIASRLVSSRDAAAGPTPIPPEAAPGLATATERSEDAAAVESTAAPSSVDVGERAFHPPMDDRDSFVRWMLSRTHDTGRGDAKRFLQWRWDCAQDLLRWNSIHDDRVLEAFLRTPREIFIREKNRSRAYEHAYMPIGYGSTITDPWVVSIMTQAVSPAPEHRVLEIGTGSGYQSAMLAQLSNHIYTVEVIEELAAETDLLFRELYRQHPEYRNIRRITGDGYNGWPDAAPFHRIIVTCSIDHVPPALLRQLAPGSIMVIPVGPPSGQTLMVIHKRADADGRPVYERRRIMPVKFIPFRDAKGRSYAAAAERGSG